MDFVNNVLVVCYVTIGLIGGLLIFHFIELLFVWWRDRRKIKMMRGPLPWFRRVRR